MADRRALLGLSAELLLEANLVVDLGDDLLGVEREIRLHHPVVVGGLTEEHLLDGHVLVLSEVEDRLLVLVPDDMAGHIHVVRLLGKSAEGLHIVLHGHVSALGARVGVLHPVVLVELGLEDIEGGAGVGVGVMGLRQIAVTVELVGSHEVARLHLVEDVLHVHHQAVAQVEALAATQELLHQQRHVELVGVEASQVGVAYEGQQVVGNFRECGLVLDILVGDAVDGRALLGNVDAWVDELRTLDLLAVRHHLDEGDLHDFVLADIQAGGFQIEKQKGFGKVDLHI